MMLLAIDAGNTRIKWGVHDGRAWRASGAVPTADAQRVSASWSEAPAPRRAIACNVAGAEVQAALEKACASRGIALEVIRSERATLGVVNGYRDASQLGADRWAALVGAHHAHAGHKLVVSSGTALTIDALAEDGRFLGGLILPGPGLMRRSLEQGTAGLRLTEGSFSILPKSTPDAITSGSIQACIGAIARLAAVMTDQGAAPRLAVLSGGSCVELAPHMPLEHVVHDTLVLDGLVRIAGRGA